MSAGDAQLLQALGNRLRDDGGRQVGLGAQQPVLAGVGHAPFAAGIVTFLLVELAQHVRAHIVAPVVQLFLELVFDDLALFLDHQDFLQALGEIAGDRRFQWPDHIHLVHPDAQLAADRVVQAQVHQGLAHVVVGLAAGNQAKAVVLPLHHVVVQLVGPHIGQRGVPLVVHQARFLLQRRIGPTDMQPARRHDKVFGQHDVHPVRIDRDAGRGLHHFLDGLQPGPQARKPAHREGVQPHVQDVLHIAGKEHRRAAGLENMVALVGGGGGLADMVIARNSNHAAVFGGARHVGVLEHIGAAVHTRALAVPDAEHAVELLGVRVQIQLLRTPDGRGGQFLVHARLKDDVIGLQMLFGGPQRLVVGAQRGAPVAADETGRVQAGLGIALALQHGQAHQRLHPAHEGTSMLQVVLVIQRDGFQCAAHAFGQGGVHRPPPCTAAAVPAPWAGRRGSAGARTLAHPASE